MRLPTGVELSLFRGQVELKTEDGYLGQITLQQALTLQVRVIPEPHHRIWAVMVDGSKKLHLKKNLAARNGNQDQNGREKLYRLTIAVKQNREGIFHTEYPQNNLRLLHLQPGGRLDFWEIAIVSQKGQFFLTRQLTYQSQCFRQGKRVLCPRFERWDSLIQALNRLPGLRQILKELPCLPKNHVRPLESHSPIRKDNRGIVLWFNLAQGKGAIETKYGHASVHWSEIHRPESLLRYLKAGEMVTFYGLRFPKSRRPTSFKREAVGVSPLPILSP